MVGAVRSVGLFQAAQERQHGFVVALAGRRVPGHGAAVAGVVLLRQVGFVKIQADAHVEQMLHRGVGIGTIARFGHQIANRGFGVEQPLVLQNAGDQRGDGL